MGGSMSGVNFAEHDRRRTASCRARLLFGSSARVLTMNSATASPESADRMMSRAGSQAHLGDVIGFDEIGLGRGAYLCNGGARS